MVRKVLALMIAAVGLAAPAYADNTDDAFIANLSTSGMNYGAPDKAIQVAKTVVCGTLNDNPNTSNPDLIAKVTSATSWPMNAAAYFTGAAIQAYCPQYTQGTPKKQGGKPGFQQAGGEIGPLKGLVNTA
ncbi:DUF732 domain-containing protein [Mycobacterium parmense]|uniref:DUF732 domain-containing protein n=1 Tax=Mycobacterium parmense TaxID=185642 RepID=A0A7I7YTX1_9MYCO|nr:DUF732 domain-containing protein [Mycobacterium parmense]MCV7351375.1 DUF732 domain-containing protein [Mycobacterium parmense]BBZ45169.1 hypothetical protein MPRM_24500 [Mycobacterium parmense]